MRMRRHGSAVHEDSHGIDLAPMLDFVMNLLVFFIITAVFVKELGLMVNRPSGAVATQASGESGAIAVKITAGDEVLVDERVVDVRAVRANVERLYAADPKRGVLILAEGDAHTGLVAQVVDQIHLGGIYNITFSTTE
jgi:biopolymer transport protein ExbD